MNRKTIHMAASTALLAMTQAQPRRELIGSRGLETVIRRQEDAKRVRRQAKKTLKAAVNQLVEISQQSVVLGHIHPRWLREAVALKIDAGETVTLEDVNAMRRAGP